MRENTQAAAVPSSKFATLHQIAQKSELIFFRGYAGENAAYGFGIHQANGTGYCSQELTDGGDEQIFELYWEPLKTRVTAGTSAEAASEIRFNNAGGFSGSLVWNSRYVEITSKGKEWTPEDAVVTGLLRRWDTSTKSLLVWRVEHLRRWLTSRTNRV